MRFFKKKCFICHEPDDLEKINRYQDNSLFYHYDCVFEVLKRPENYDYDTIRYCIDIMELKLKNIELRKKAEEKCDTLLRIIHGR